jgi:hypothetical protein
MVKLLSIDQGKGIEVFYIQFLGLKINLIINLADWQTLSLNVSLLCTKWGTMTHSIMTLSITINGECALC